MEALASSLSANDELSLRQGYVIMADECAVDERLRHDQHSDEVTGLCREHVSVVDIKVSSLDNLLEIKLALDEGAVH
jgi:hypothetical protein